MSCSNLYDIVNNGFSRQKVYFSAVSSIVAHTSLTRLGFGVRGW
jgi:hypothetical protein